LREEPNLPDDEDDISEVLALKTRQANFSLNQKNRGLSFPPEWEKPIQPASKANIGQNKKKKKPDFSCPFRNDSAQNFEEAWLDYHIECKRLGKPSSPSWILNRNYVENGIVRFLDPQHRYGKGAKSGAMIGYVQNMDTESILKEINETIQGSTKYKISLITFSGNGFDEKGITKTSQKFSRKHVLPSLFHLRHIWVDLR
tara:strand:+ start:2638 stop:3237 length:600 start_codon:yes stop_codon:yes gene_type:complete